MDILYILLYAFINLQYYFIKSFYNEMKLRNNQEVTVRVTLANSQFEIHNIIIKFCALAMRGTEKENLLLHYRK